MNAATLIAESLQPSPPDGLFALAFSVRDLTLVGCNLGANVAALVLFVLGLVGAQPSACNAIRLGIVWVVLGAPAVVGAVLMGMHPIASLSMPGAALVLVSAFGRGEQPLCR